MTKDRDLRFERLMAKYEASDIVKQMDSHIHHGDTTTYEHCCNVARTSYLFNKKYHLHADDKTLVTSAMLHDLYLYDRHDGSHSRTDHRFNHADVACRNAEKHFTLTEKEKAIIKCHMWPLNISRFPESKEALIICMMDKYCAAVETVQSNRIWNFASRKKNLLLSYVK